MNIRLTFLYSFLLLCFCEHNVDACLGGKKKAAKPHTTQSTNPNQDNPSSKSPLGDNVKTNPYDNSGYDGKNGVANGPDDLKCDFESNNCCWKNTKPPYDTMEFIQASGSPDPDKLQKNFGTSTAPSGNFLMTMSDSAAAPSDKAEFESCSIACAGDSIKVTLKHWVSQGVKLEVCEVSKSDPGTLLACQSLPPASPGPDTVTLPPGSDIILSIVASGFTSGSGGIALIDEISVDYPPCSTTPATTASTPSPPQPQPQPQPPPETPAPVVETQPPPPSNDDAKNLCCDFSQGPCNWQKGSGPSSPKGNVRGFDKAGPGRFKNPATGVPPSPDKSFMASYMMSQESSYMESASDMQRKLTIKFQEYKATKDVNLKACCDTEQGCSYDTGNGVEKGDFRQWFQGSIDCPAGTKKVIFYSENSGLNEGGVGIDNVQVYDENGQQIC